MSPAAEILVVILSVFLAIFLVLGIALFIYLIILTRQIRRITQSAEKAVDNIGSVVSGMSKMISPMYVAESIARLFKKNKSKKRE